MPRAKRKEEDYLEDNEPVGVVILNDIVYLLEDIGEIIMDIAKIQRKRPDEFKDILAASKEGLDAMNKLVPEEIADKVKVSVFDLMGVALSLKNEVTQTEGTSISVGGIDIDPEKLTPEQLETLGKALKEQTEKIGKAIRDYEESLLKEKK